jgi:hypothetical protein
MRTNFENNFALVNSYFLVQIIRFFGFAAFFAVSLSAQNLPEKIRGYKVYKAEIIIKTANEKKASKAKTEAFVTVTEPELVDISLTGITFEISAEIDALAQSGKVDFLTFNDFQVNGLSVEIEEYKNSFEFKKNQPISLPKPARFFLGTGQTLRGALNELKNSKTEWQVTGRIFVFGKFKKYGFSFKRVIPIEINIKIKNPLK